MSFKIQRRKSKSTKLERSLAKKAKKQREQLLAEERDFRMRGIKTFDPVTGESIPFTLTERDWAIQYARELRDRIASEISNAAVSLFKDTEETVTSEENIPAVEHDNSVDATRTNTSGKLRRLQEATSKILAPNIKNN
ncbi:hypothetical protein MFLAVUS_008039 [Mucor flavus]|uniref:Uncharacterized protein n=1 Tax=Mucor flavus TaxID=439312 RepID=A0ABP9Z650_9FUNG